MSQQKLISRFLKKIEKEKTLIVLKENGKFDAMTEAGYALYIYGDKITLAQLLVSEKAKRILEKLK